MSNDNGTAGKKDRSTLSAAKSMGKSFITCKFRNKNNSKSRLTEIYGKPANNKAFLSNRASLVTLPQIESLTKYSRKSLKKRTPNTLKERSHCATRRNTTELLPKNRTLSYPLHEQYAAFMELFSDIIEHSVENSFHLKRIKDFIEDYTRGLKKGQELNEDYKKQIEHLSRENFTLSKTLESLLSKQKDPDDNSTANRDSVSESLSPSEPSTVPRLSLQIVHSSGFHEEFMKRVDEFSVSWREALHEGR